MLQPEVPTVDVPAQAVPLPEIPVDFTVESAEVIFRGRCSNCS